MHLDAIDVELSLDDEERLTHGYFRDAQRSAIGLARFASDEDDGLVEISVGEIRVSTVPLAIIFAGATLEIGVDDLTAAQMGTATLTIALERAAYDAALLRDVITDLTRGYGVFPTSASS